MSRGKTENGAASHNAIILSGMPDLGQSKLMRGFDSDTPFPSLEKPSLSSATEMG